MQINLYNYRPMPSPEVYRSPDKVNLREIIITPGEQGTLYEANHSEEADRRSLAWEKNKAEGKLWLVVACGDARIMIPMPEKIESLRSIAIGGERVSEILESNGNQLSIVISHIDGDTIIPRKMPTGCGGHAEKINSLKEMKGEKPKGLHHYVEARVHPDPIIQAFRTARDIRNKSKKPSLAVIQDHRTGEIYPLAAFLADHQITPIELDEIDSKYDEARIYEKGIPKLKDTVIPDVFAEFLSASRDQYRKMLDQHPQLKEMQRIQNPRMIVVSTKLPSLRIRYPEIADALGIAFKLHLPRYKEAGKTLFKPESVEELISQIQYPIEHAIKNCNQPDQPFSQTDRVLIETSDINASNVFAARLVREDWMKKWLSLPDHQLIVIQNLRGISNIIEEYRS